MLQELSFTLDVILCWHYVCTSHDTSYYTMLYAFGQSIKWHV